MLFRKASIFAFACMLSAAGCRDNGALTPADLSMTGPGGNGDMATGGGGGGDMMKSYMVSTIAAMRAGSYGDFELDNVVVLAVNPGGSRMYVQDAAGGKLSAIEVSCPAGGTHVCTISATVKAAKIGDQVTVKGTYVKAGATKGNYETFYVDTMMDNGAAPTKPTATTLTIADVISSAGSGTNSRDTWFQKVSVTLTDALVMFDMNPMVFAHTPAAGKTCPNTYGWGMVPMTGAPSAPAACDASCATKTPPATCTQPAAATATSTMEVLVGTDFYSGFTYSNDCKCYSGFSDTVVTPANHVASGATIQGILVYYSPQTGTPYLYLAPTVNADFPLQ
jgi:hypothetical protein